MPYMSETELQRLYREAEFDAVRIAALEAENREYREALERLKQIVDVVPMSYDYKQQGIEMARAALSKYPKQP